MLRQTFGKELEKLPQFSALVNCLKYECSHTFTEIACQTSGLNGSINVIDNINNNGVCGGLPISNEETLRRRQLLSSSSSSSRTRLNANTRSNNNGDGDRNEDDDDDDENGFTSK